MRSPLASYRTIEFTHCGNSRRTIHTLEDPCIRITRRCYNTETLFGVDANFGLLYAYFDLTTRALNVTVGQKTVTIAQNVAAAAPLESLYLFVEVYHDTVYVVTVGDWVRTLLRVRHLCIGDAFSRTNANVVQWLSIKAPFWAFVRVCMILREF